MLGHFCTAKERLLGISAITIDQHSSTKQGIKRPIIPSFHFMSATFHFMHQLLLLHYNQSSEPPNSIIHPKLVSIRLLFKRAKNHQKQIFLLILLLLLAPLKIPRPTIKQTLCFQTGTVRGKEKNRVGMGECSGVDGQQHTSIDLKNHNKIGVTSMINYVA